MPNVIVNWVVFCERIAVDHQGNLVDLCNIYRPNCKFVFQLPNHHQGPVTVPLSSFIAVASLTIDEPSNEPIRVRIRIPPLSENEMDLVFDDQAAWISTGIPSQVIGPLPQTGSDIHYSAEISQDGAIIGEFPITIKVGFSKIPQI